MASRAARVEFFGSGGCRHTEDMREWLERRGVEFVEYDVDTDPAARARLVALAGAQRMVPMLVEDDKVTQVGWQGRGCVVAIGS